MKIKNIFIVVVVIALGLTACKKEKYDIEYAPLKDLSGEWWVTSVYDDGTGDVDDHGHYGHWILTTSNTAGYSTDSILITDSRNMWEWNVTAGLNYEAKTFSVTDAYDYFWGINVTITNGQIIKDGGITKDGNVTDSIYMEVDFSDLPGEHYIISGVRRTGFLEDEY